MSVRRKLGLALATLTLIGVAAPAAQAEAPTLPALMLAPTNATEAGLSRLSKLRMVMTRTVR